MLAQASIFRHTLNVGSRRTAYTLSALTSEAALLRLRCRPASCDEERVPPASHRCDCTGLLPASRGPARSTLLLCRRRQALPAEPSGLSGDACCRAGSSDRLLLRCGPVRTGGSIGLTCPNSIARWCGGACCSAAAAVPAAAVVDAAAAAPTAAAAGVGSNACPFASCCFAGPSPAGSVLCHDASRCRGGGGGGSRERSALRATPAI